MNHSQSRRKRRHKDFFLSILAHSLHEGRDGDEGGGGRGERAGEGGEVEREAGGEKGEELQPQSLLLLPLWSLFFTLSCEERSVFRGTGEEERAWEGRGGVRPG